MATVRVKVRVIRHTGTNRKRIGCPLTKHRSAWCYRLCAPMDGLGVCGRVAPHALRGRTDMAIEKYLEQRRDDE
ncbi:MAG: hypothetical protein ACYTE6_15590 [Planctomycetota bacterium]|jgi:hypothetical protein